MAAHLAPAIVAAGHQIGGVWSRSSAHAAALLSRLPPGPHWLPTPAAAAALAPDLVLVAVADQAVAGVIAEAALPPTVAVAHTAGTLPLPDHARAGVLYPLQTFSALRPLDMKTVPFCLEARDPATAAILDRLAHDLSARPPLWLTAAERAPLHLAAVFAANFTNHLLGISCQLLATSAVPVDFDVLRPLVEEVVAKAFAAPDGPFSVQTGPAARHDAATLRAQRERLAAAAVPPAWTVVYDVLSATIQAAAPLPPPHAAD